MNKYQKAQKERNAKFLQSLKDKGLIKYCFVIHPSNIDYLKSIQPELKLPKTNL